MRKNPTPAERKLWQALRSKAFDGLKIRRQVPFGPYILDFYIPQYRIAIEVDGATHADPLHDLNRTNWFESQGIRTLRFWNNEVMGNLEGVLGAILADIGRVAPPPPAPLPQGEGE